MKIRVLVLGVFISFISFAQIKPHIGMNWAQLSTEPQDFTKEGRAGFVIGAGFKFGEKVYFEPGIQFSNLGTKLISKGGDDNGNIVEHQSYVQTIRVPVMVGYDFMEKDAFVNFRIFTGPSASFVMGVNTENSQPSIGGVNLPTNKDDYADIIWGWNFGAGLDISIVYLEFSYELGISNFYSDAFSSHAETKNNAFYLTAGINLF